MAEAGHAAFAPLQQKSRDEAAALAVGQQGKLIGAMATVQHLLEAPAATAGPRTTVLREPRPGDIGWVVQQHGEIYACEYGWNMEDAARAIYARRGFRLVKSEPHRSYGGHALSGETWELKL